MSAAEIAIVFLIGGLLFAAGLMIGRRTAGSRGAEPAAPGPDVEAGPRPNFGANLLGANIFKYDDAELVGVALELDIWNSGEPAYATGWSLRIDAPGITAEGRAKALPDQLTARGDQATIIRSSQSLIEKLSGRRVLEAPVRGTLLFQFAVDKAAIVHPDARYTLTVGDSLNGSASFSRTIRDW